MDKKSYLVECPLLNLITIIIIIIIIISIVIVIIIIIIIIIITTIIIIIIIINPRQGLLLPTHLNFANTLPTKIDE